MRFIPFALMGASMVMAAAHVNNVKAAHGLLQNILPRGDDHSSYVTDVTTCVTGITDVPVPVIVTETSMSHSIYTSCTETPCIVVGTTETTTVPATGYIVPPVGSGTTPPAAPTYPTGGSVSVHLSSPPTGPTYGSETPQVSTTPAGSTPPSYNTPSSQPVETPSGMPCASCASSSVPSSPAPSSAPSTSHSSGGPPTYGSSPAPVPTAPLASNDGMSVHSDVLVWNVVLAVLIGAAVFGAGPGQ